MKIITEEIGTKGKKSITLRKLVADSGKYILDINDVYEKEHIDEKTGELIPEHTPYYTDTIYLGKQVKDSDIEKLYIEETIK